MNEEIEKAKNLLNEDRKERTKVATDEFTSFIKEWGIKHGATMRVVNTIENGNVIKNSIEINLNL